VNPTVEDAYWRDNHGSQEWAGEEADYDQYAPAYRTGYEGVTKYAGRDYNDIEGDLARDYDKNDANPAIPWDRARPAVKAAWHRVAGTTGPRDNDRGTRGNI